MKYKSPRIKDLSGADLKKAVLALIIRMHVITGWKMPEGAVLKTLTDQLNKFLSERYHMMNVDEIEFAFRKHGIGVNAWGSSMNLTLISEVLEAYLIDRQRISEIEAEVKNPPPVQRIFTQDELDDLARGDAQAAYAWFLSSGGNCLNPEINARILAKDGFLQDRETVMDFFKRWAAKGHSSLYRKA